MAGMEGVIGQERALQVLDAALRSGRVHHAYIFHGPAGVGKFTTALALAKVLLCQQMVVDQGPVRACGRCPSCVRLGAAGPGRPPGEHPDLHVVTKELALFSGDAAVRERKLMNIPVRVLEEHLLGPVYRSTTMRHGKVFIVDEAELLDPIGQNKLLKTLEEPPEGTVIILVTSSEERLLATIRSRCQRVAFVPLGPERMAAWLDGQEPGLEASARAWLLGFADGSLGRARLALDYGLAGWAARLVPGLEEMTRGRLPAELGRQVQEMIEAFAARWVKERENASKDAANKLAAGLVWSIWMQQARGRLAAAAGGTGAAAAAGPWLAAIDALAEAERYVAANVNLGLVCDHLVLSLFRALRPVAGPAGRS